MSTKSKSFYLLLVGILLLQACNVDSSFETETIHLGALWPKAEMKIRGGVADSQGNIYAMDENGILHAVNSKGKERWNYQGDYEQASPPIFDENTKTIYFITDTNSLFAVDQSGKKKWSFKGDSAIISYPKLAPDGSIYLQATGKNSFGSGYRIFHVFSDGTHETFALDEYYDLDQSAIGSDGTLYLWDWEAFTVFSADGEKLKKCKSGDIGQIKSDLTTGPDDTVLLVIEGGTVIAIRPDCSIYWHSSVTANKEFIFKYSLIYDKKQTIFIGGPDGTLHALDAKSGQQLWKSEENLNIGEIVSVVMLDDGFYYAVSSRGYFLAFDSQGKQKWREELFYPGVPVTFQRLSSDDILILQNSHFSIYTKAASRKISQPIQEKPTDEEQAETEIIAFAVDFIVKYEIGEMADYIVTSGQPWVDAPPDASIIIYGPPVIYRNEFAYVDIHNPIKVWWFADGQLSEVDERLKAIQQYQNEYMENPQSDIFVWGEYDFGIVTIDSDFRSAEIHVGTSCGPLCGHVMRYKIQRSPSGEWWIYEEDQLSVS